MGKLVEGKWRDEWYDTSKTGGEFVRPDTVFRHTLGENDFPVESGRYRLYVSLACPWAHRTLIYRTLKGLEKHLPVSVVSPLMGENGWAFESDSRAASDPHHGAAYLYELYLKANPTYTGRVTVPVLWDSSRSTIVNNESAEIIRQLNSVFDPLTGNTADFYPAELRDRIDETNEWVYDTINNGVYKCGFATTQQAYERNHDALFRALDRVEETLSSQPFLCGEWITEADWRLFTTLVRFDAVYVGHFKCNRNRIADFSEIQDYLRCLYQVEGVAGTCNLDQIKTHYYGSHRNLNPTGIVPVGPRLDLDSPSRRTARWKQR